MLHVFIENNKIFSNDYKQDLMCKAYCRRQCWSILKLHLPRVSIHSKISCHNSTMHNHAMQTLQLTPVNLTPIHSSIIICPIAIA